MKLNLQIIKTLCKIKKVSLKEFSAKIGFSEAGVSRAIKNNKTTSDFLEKASEFFGCSVEVFFGGPDYYNQTIKIFGALINNLNFSIKETNISFEDFYLFKSLLSDKENDYIFKYATLYNDLIDVVKDTQLKVLLFGLINSSDYAVFLNFINGFKNDDKMAQSFFDMLNTEK